MATARNAAPAVVALLCVLAFGVVGTSLDSAVSTKPAEVIDLDYDEVPIEQEQAQTIKESVSGEPQDERTPQPDASQSEDASTQPKQGDGDETIADPDRAADGIGVGSGQPTLVDKFLSWLRALLTTVLPFLALLVTLGLAYRYRRRLAALAGAILGGVTTGTSETDEREAEPWEGIAPSTIVDRAWVDLAKRLDLENPRARTPTEVRSAALQAGMDSNAVETLTLAFREIQYGDGELTDDRRQQVRECAERLGLGGIRP